MAQQQAQPNTTIPSDWPSRREMMQQMTLSSIAALGPLSSSLEESWTIIKLSDGWESKTKVIRPKQQPSTTAKPKLVVLFYGGGNVAGSPDQITRPGREIAEKYGVVVVAPNYRLAPENPWPAQARDGWEIVSHLSKHAEADYGVNLDAATGGGFVVGGFSAGACIAAITAGIAAFGDGSAKVFSLSNLITGLFIGVPWLFQEETVPENYKSLWTSRTDNANVPGFNTAGLQPILGAMQCTNYASPWFSPTNSFRQGISDAQAKRHPPAYVQVGQFDPLRDDGIIYEKILAKHGISTKIDLFPDDGHVAWTAQPIPSKSKNPTVEEATMAGFGWLIEHK